MSPKHPVKERAWGTRYDTLESSPVSSPSQRRSSTPPTTHSPTAATVAESPSKRISSPKGNNMDPTPHDASIFIGSLPANIDYSELTQRLSEHFSAHPQVKAIKVVRDSRGGVCGFIQCENPAAAGRMLQDLAENPPRPFCGRFLRFEAAKAFRTLLVSYRIPTEVAYTVCSDDPFGSPGGGRPASPRLAHALRIFRPRNARHLGILYDSEALNFDSNAAAEPQGDVSDAFCGEGLLIQDLAYDEKTIQRIVSAFGPLETFKMGSTDAAESKHETSLYPYPHDGPRSPEMSRGVWEVKWRNREDSVLALLTLRRIPHLMVNWAHHHPLTLNTDPFNANDGPFTKGLWLSPTMRRGYSEHSGRDDRGSPSTSHTSHAPAATPLQPMSYRTDTPDAASGQTSPPAKGTLATSDLSPPDATPSSLGESSSRWADQVTELDVYGEISLSVCKTPSTPSLNGVRANKSFSPFTKTMRPSVADQSPRDTPGAFFSPTLRLSSVSSDVDRRQASALRTEAPQAITSPGQSAFPHVPRSNQVSRPVEQSDIDALSSRLRDLPTPTGEIDPRTVFVGGLNVQDPDEWDEHRLRRIFEQYGLIESVQIVRPLTKRTCFAFVQFTNSESATRAVRGEHNRVHDGRPLRVQLRDRNPPPHASWGLGRGRGRNRFGGISRPHQDPPGYASVGTVDSAVVQMPLELPGAPSPTAAAHGPSSLAPDNHCTGMLRTPGHGDLQRRSSYGMTNSSASSVSSSTTKVPSVHDHDSHRPSSTTNSPAPIALASASSAVSAMAPFPPPHHMSVGYFPPQPWAQPYHAPYSYPIPVMPGYAYPGYPYSHIPQAPPAFVASGASGLSSSVSISAFADNALNHADKATNNDEHGPQAQSGTQPPLRPTGFIQNEQGTLIPVYQREALDQYMASAHPGEPSPQTSSVPTPSASASATGVAPWPAPPFPYYGAPYPTMGHPAPVHPPPVQGGYWFPGGPPHTVAPFPPTQPPSVPPQPFHPSVAGSAPDGTSRAGPPLNAHGQYPSGQRGGFYPRRYNNRRGNDNAHGGNAFNGSHHARFTNQPSSAIHAFVRGPS